MADEQLGDILEAMRAPIQAQLDAQTQALNARHEQALAKARAEADADAERRWSSKVDAVRAEWSARLQSEVAAARAEAEKRMVAETVRAKADAEQAAIEAAGRARRELDQAVAAERQRLTAQVEEERLRSREELERATAAFDAERQQLQFERDQRDAEAAAAASQQGAGTADTRVLLDAFSAVQNARSLSDGLAALVQAAAHVAPRVALFVVNGSHLDEWSVPGVPQLSQLSLNVESETAGVLSAAVRRGERVTTGESSAPAFAGLPAGGLGAAVPMLVGGEAVAVLYADEGRTGSGRSAEWLDAVELLARHGAARLAELTAIRALQVLERRSGNGHHSAAAPDQSSESDDQGARRYARLLVSEIKLYNEAAVRLGRERRDLLQRLRPEIERARRLYEDRVPPSLAARGAYFHDELVQTLADGDPALLGQ